MSVPPQPSGFTLVLDGPPGEVERVLAAAGSEYRKLQEECAGAADALLGEQTRPHSLYQPRSSLRGRVELRYDVHRALLDVSRPA